MARLDIEANDDTLEWLVSQSHDFGLSTSEPSNPSLDSLTLYRGKVSGVLSKNHLLAGHASIRPEDMEGESYISYIAGPRFRHAIDRVFDQHGINHNLCF